MSHHHRRGEHGAADTTERRSAIQRFESGRSARHRLSETLNGCDPRAQPEAAWLDNDVTSCQRRDGNDPCIDLNVQVEISDRVMAAERVLLLLLQVVIGVVLWRQAVRMSRGATGDSQDGAGPKRVNVILTLATITTLALLLTPVFFGDAAATAGTVILLISVVLFALYGHFRRARR